MYVDALLFPSRFKAKRQIDTRHPKRPWGLVGDSLARFIGGGYWQPRREKPLVDPYEVLRGHVGDAGAAGVLSCKTSKGNS
jgi:hypothetical protein